jgi:hypothetical protein
MASKALPDLPSIDLTFPWSALAEAAVLYAKEYTSEATLMHTIRSAYFAVILWKKLPQFREIDIESVVVGCILHDLGWSTVEGFGHTHMRFEVDGAELARKWIREQAKVAVVAEKSGDEGFVGDGGGWDDERRQQLLWDSVALHTSPDFAMYKEPEVALTSLAVMVDFSADKTPGGAVTREEFKEVVRAFPRAGFGVEGLKRIMCGLCERKPETTFSNFVGSYGRRFGYDGEGGGVEEFGAKADEADLIDAMLGGLAYSGAIAEEVEAEKKAALIE